MTTSRESNKIESENTCWTNDERTFTFRKAIFKIIVISLILMVISSYRPTNSENLNQSSKEYIPLKFASLKVKIFDYSGVRANPIHEIYSGINKKSKNTDEEMINESKNSNLANKTANIKETIRETENDNESTQNQKYLPTPPIKSAEEELSTLKYITLFTVIVMFFLLVVMTILASLVGRR